MTLLMKIYNIKYKYRLIISTFIAFNKKKFDNREKRQVYDCSTCD